MRNMNTQCMPYISYFSYHRPLLNKFLALLWKCCTRKKKYICCLDVVTSISVMIRMIKTTRFFSWIYKSRNFLHLMYKIFFLNPHWKSLGGGKHMCFV
jgi:hypothetical protein